jgi:excinuclease ABC subunit A
MSILKRKRKRHRVLALFLPVFRVELDVSRGVTGGEVQRVKISAELYRAHLQKTIYLLDEPTVGLHYDDVAKLIEILQRLVNKGNTVVVIERNLDLICAADYVIDIGPDGGSKGGKLVAKGTPEDVAKNKNSYTGT